MDHDELIIAAEEILQHLEAVSFVAQRDAKQALPAVEPFGAADTLFWLETARDLFFHDRDAGKAFMRETLATVEKTGVLRPWVEQAASFAQWRGSWKALEAFMEQVGAVYRSWGAAGERQWYELGHTWLGRHLDSGVAYFRTPFEELSGGRGIEGARALLGPAERLFHERRLALGSYIGGALRVRRLIGEAGLGEWAQRGADILQSGRKRGEAYFRLESEEAMAMLLAATPGVRTREHARLYQLLVWAWFGEDVLLEDSGWRPDTGRPLVETDGRRLFLPAVMPEREEALLAVVHVAGHLHFNTYERRHIDALFGLVGMRHPPVDEQQRITWRPLFANYGEDLLRFQLLFDLCEDLRVDAAIDRLVPGHLRRLRRAARAQAPVDGPAAAYRAAAIASLDGALGEAQLDAPVAALLAPEATVVDAFRAAQALYADTHLPPVESLAVRDAALLPGRSPNAARAVYPRHCLDERDRELGEGVDAEARDPQPREKTQKPPKKAAGDDPDFNDIPPEDIQGTGGRVGVGIPQPAIVIGQGSAQQPRREGWVYPEWDYRENGYKLDWAWVQERELEERDPARAEQILAAQGNVLKRLRRALQMQRPHRMAPQRRQMDGDELDLEATLEFVTERRAGRSPRPHVYKRRGVQTRDTAVLLLADLSTSIMAESADGEGRVVDSLRAGLMLFAEALDAVGDPCAIAGFASKYRDNVSFYPIKRFDEPLTPGVRAAIAGVSGRLATRMGAAIRHGLGQFRSTAAARRLLLILSDGRPADYDDGGDRRYLQEDTRMAVKEAAERGVHPFCVTLDPAGSEYLPAIFGAGHYLVLDHVHDLPRRLPEIYLRLRG